MQTNDNINWQPGQRVITRDGVVAVVTHRTGALVWGIGPRDSAPRPIRPVGDAWGGEHDCEVCNAA
jgi:hypothetical protein